MVKSIFAVVVMAFFSVALKAQLNPVNWSFIAKKVADKKYEIHIVALIQPTWHLYSQIQPENAIAIPTDIRFNGNPLVSLDGKIKEVGKLIKFKDEQLGISANQYSQKVEFVQVVKLRGNVKTNISGTVEYQTCDDKRCLPPRTVSFSVAMK